MKERRCASSHKGQQQRGERNRREFIMLPALAQVSVVARSALTTTAPKALVASDAVGRLFSSRAAPQVSRM